MWGWGERKTQKQRSSDYISCGEHDDTKTKDVLRGKDLSLSLFAPSPNLKLTRTPDGEKGKWLFSHQRGPITPHAHTPKKKKKKVVALITRPARTLVVQLCD